MCWRGCARWRTSMMSIWRRLWSKNTWERISRRGISSPAVVGYGWRKTPNAWRQSAALPVQPQPHHPKKNTDLTKTRSGKRSFFIAADFVRNIFRVGVSIGEGGDVSRFPTEGSYSPRNVCAMTISTGHALGIAVTRYAREGASELPRFPARGMRSQPMNEPSQTHCDSGKSPLFERQRRLGELMRHFWFLCEPIGPVARRCARMSWKKLPHRCGKPFTGHIRRTHPRQHRPLRRLAPSREISSSDAVILLFFHRDAITS